MTFSLGRIVVTRGVNDRVAVDTPFAKFVVESLKRHANCDWGDLSAEDKRENDLALQEGGRLFSAYYIQPGKGGSKVWIISEADRSVTTILFPEEY